MTYSSIRVVMAARPADVQVVVGLLGSGCKVRLSSCRNRRNPRRVCAFVKRSLGEIDLISGVAPPSSPGVFELAVKGGGALNKGSAMIAA